MHLIEVKRCLKLICSDQASIVDTMDYSIYSWDEWIMLDTHSDEFVIPTTSSNVKVPEVIVLKKYDKVFMKDLRLTKRNIYIRDKYKCQYSGEQLNYDEANIDHVIPRSRGGKKEWSNLVVCSKEINSIKGDRTPEEAGLKLIKKPVKPVSDGPHRLLDDKFDMPKSWSKFISSKQQL